MSGTVSSSRSVTKVAHCHLAHFLWVAIWRPPLGLVIQLIFSDLFKPLMLKHPARFSPRNLMKSQSNRTLGVFVGPYHCVSIVDPFPCPSSGPNTSWGSTRSWAENWKLQWCPRPVQGRKGRPSRDVQVTYPKFSPAQGEKYCEPTDVDFTLSDEAELG